MEYNKITTGFVVQEYTTTIDGKHICTSQVFVAGDEVDREDTDTNEIVKIDTTKEQYQPFDMKQPPTTTSEKGLIFTCPKCKSNRLECCEYGHYNSEVLTIDEDGDFDYGEIGASGMVERFQCLSCGYVLIKEDGSSIDDNEEVIKWIKKNCEQPEGYIDPRYLDDNADQFENE